MDPEHYINDIVNDCVICTVLRLVKGRTWLVELPDGQRIEVASKSFKGIVETSSDEEE